jgi:uncharacterized protein YceK
MFKIFRLLAIFIASLGILSGCSSGQTQESSEHRQDLRDANYYAQQRMYYEQQRGKGAQQYGSSSNRKYAAKKAAKRSSSVKKIRSAKIYRSKASCNCVRKKSSSHVKKKRKLKPKIYG